MSVLGSITTWTKIQRCKHFFEKEKKLEMSHTHTISITLFAKSIKRLIRKTNFVPLATQSKID